MSVALAWNPTAVPSSSITVEEINSPETLPALEPAWEALAEEAHVAHPFASHLWTTTFWQAFGATARLRVLVVKRSGRIIAIAPFAQRTRERLGMKVRVIETIRNDHSPCSELILTHRPSESCRAILEHLLRDAADWDMLELAHLPSNSASLRYMRRQAAHAGLKTGVVEFVGSPYIALPPDWSLYVKTLGRNHRSNLRNKRNRLERIGTIGLDCVASDVTAGDIDDAFRLESSAWKGAAGSAIASDPRTTEFYRSLACRAADRGWLKLQFLTLGDRRIAMSFGLRHDDRLHVLKSGYDVDFKEYSPSNVLHELVIRQAVADGVREFDFLGDADPWKMLWTSTLRPHTWLYVFPNHFRARLFHLAKFGTLARMRRRRRVAAPRRETPSRSVGA